MYLPQQYRLESPRCPEQHPNDASVMLDGIPRLMIDCIPRPPLEYLIPEKPLSPKTIRSRHGRSPLLSSMEQGPTTIIPPRRTTNAFPTSSKQVDNSSKNVSTPVRKHTQLKSAFGASTCNNKDYSIQRSAVSKRTYKNVSDAPLSPPRVPACRWSAVAAEDAAAAKRSPGGRKLTKIPRLPARHPSSDGLLQNMVIDKTRTALAQRP